VERSPRLNLQLFVGQQVNTRGSGPAERRGRSPPGWRTTAVVANEEETVVVQAEEREGACARRSRREKWGGAVGKEERLEKGKERNPRKEEGAGRGRGICSLRQAMQQLLERE
jgi:hypothetical protein